MLLLVKRDFAYLGGPEHTDFFKYLQAVNMKSTCHDENKADEMD